MRKSIITLCGLIFAMGLFSQGPDTSVRINQLFNFDWKFKAGKVDEAINKSYDDSNWKKLDLPHDFPDIEQEWSKSGGGARGYKAMGRGSYRKTFRADTLWKGKRVLLDFEGLMLNGEVWFNAKKWLISSSATSDMRQIYQNILTTKATT